MNKISKILSPFLISFLLIQLMVGIFLFVPKPQEAKADAASWYSLSWLYRKPITVDNTNGTSTLTNYQVKVSVTYDSHMQSNFGDIRFTDSDGTTLLDHWREIYTTSTSATFWVKVPSIATSSTATIYMYYGNSSATSASNGDNTFEFFDDFDNNSNRPYDSIFNLFKGKPWTRYSGNPILSKSASGWDSYGLRDEMLMVDANDNLVKENGEYIMYYRGNEYDATFSTSPDHIKRQIGRATSTDGITWVKDTTNNPVLQLGTTGQWDDQEIGSAWVIKLGTNNYAMYYDGYHGSISGIGLATSTDGINWTKYAGNPLLRATDFAGLTTTTVMAILSCIKASGGVYALYFETGSPSSAIFGATSINGTSFTVLNAGQAVLTGTAGEWDHSRVANPKIVEIENGKYIMGYNGDGDISGEQLGFAFSTDLVHWTKYRENPVMLLGASGQWDDSRVENAFITKDDVGSSTFRLWYFGCPTSNGVVDCALGYATSDQNATVSIFEKWSTGGNPEISTEQVHSGSYSSKIDTGTSEYMKRTQTYSGSFDLTFYQYFSTSSGRISDIEVQSGANYGLYLKYDTGHLYHYQKTIGWTDLGAYSINTWHKIETKHDIQRSKIKIYVDNSYIGEYALFSTTITGFSAIYFGGYVASTYYTDDVFVHKYTSPEPSSSLGDEEGYPIAPTIGIPTGLSPSSIRWNFIDNSNYETGFRLYNNADAIATSSATADLTSLTETGLSENTQYTRYVKAYNSYGESASSSATSTYTLADTPTGFNFMRHPSSLDIYVDSFPNSSLGSSGYLFWRTDNSAYNSGWIQTNNWQDTHMVEGTTYTYAVKYRNGNGVETATTTMGGVSFVRDNGGGGTLTIPQQTTSTSSQQATTTSATSTQVSTTTTQQTSTSTIPNLAGLTGQARQVAIQQIRDMIAQIQKQLIILIGQLIQALQMQLSVN